MCFFKIFFFGLLTSASVSCMVLKKPNLSKSIKPLEKSNLFFLNGKYSIEPDSGACNNAFNQQLVEVFNMDKYYDLINRPTDSLVYLTITVLDEKKLDINLSFKDSILCNKIVKGKLNKGTFIIKRWIKISPGIILFWMHETRKARLYITNEGNLKVDLAYVDLVYFLVLPSFGNIYRCNNLSYSRK